MSLFNLNLKNIIFFYRSLINTLTTTFVLFSFPFCFCFPPSKAQSPFTFSEHTFSFFSSFPNNRYKFYFSLFTIMAFLGRSKVPLARFLSTSTSLNGNIKTVTIVGSGLMGSGIAQVSVNLLIVSVEV